MASLTTYGETCTTCNRLAGCFSCRGCNAHFCTEHVIQHRENLRKNMDEIMQEHDRLRDSLNGKIENMCPHDLLERIDQWEKSSMLIIAEKANEAREKLSNIAGKYKEKTEERLKPLAETLKQCLIEDNFHEQDLSDWLNGLNRIKKDFEELSNAVVVQSYNANFDFTKLIVAEKSNNLFHEVTNDIQISGDGQVITHGFFPIYGSARGRNEYSTGCHLLCFEIKQAKDLDGLFVGITSTTTAIQARSSVMSCAYGWSAGNKVYMNGGEVNDAGDDEGFIQANRAIYLSINCDEKTICLIDNVAGKSYELDVDEGLCPLPWRFTVCLAYWGDQIDLLPI